MSPGGFAVSTVSIVLNEAPLAQNMRRLWLATLLVCSVSLFFTAHLSFGQQASPSPDPTRNHHILLVPVSAPGTSEPFFVAVSPTGALAILPVSQVQAKLGEGYRPYTFGEFQDALAMLINQNAALNVEVTRLQAHLPAQYPRTCPPGQAWVITAGGGVLLD
jgi:hypothetical protein